MKFIKNSIIIALLLCEVTMLNAQQNLVLNNPGFELGTGASWDFLQLDGSVADFSVTDQNPQEGNYCLGVEVTTLGSNSWSIQLKKNGWAVSAGKTYQITVWAKAATTGSKMNFTVGKYTDPYTEYNATYGISLTQSWKEYTMLLESEVTSTDDITLALHISSLDSYWFDNFNVIELSNEVTGASVPTSGNKIEITFRDALLEPSDEIQLPFFVTNQEGEEKSIGAISLLALSNTLVLTLADPVYQSETITLEYIPGTLSTELGNEIAAFSLEVENNSTVMPNAIDNSISEELHVYPNPANHFIEVVTDISVENYSYQIIDLTGSVSLSGIIQSATTNRIDVSILEQGFYILRVCDTNNSSLIYNFLKN